MPALKRHVWKIIAANALYFLNQFLLKLVLDFILFNVDLWDWVGAHELIYDTIGKHEIKLTLLWILFFLWLDSYLILNGCLIEAKSTTSHAGCLLS